MENVQDRLMEQLQSLDGVYEEYAKSRGMTYLTLVMLEEIYELGVDCTQKRISEETRYPKQTVNLVVKSFLEKGYVELKETAEDRRNKRILLTESGRRLCEGIVVPLLERENAVLIKMGETQSCELLRLLSQYCALYRESVGSLNEKR